MSFTLWLTLWKILTRTFWMCQVLFTYKSESHKNIYTLYIYIWINLFFLFYILIQISWYSILSFSYFNKLSVVSTLPLFEAIFITFYGVFQFEFCFPFPSIFPLMMDHSFISIELINGKTAIHFIHLVSRWTLVTFAEREGTMFGMNIFFIINFIHYYKFLLKNQFSYFPPIHTFLFLTFS